VYDFLFVTIELFSLALSAMSHLRFCRATQSRDKIAGVTWHLLLRRYRRKSVDVSDFEGGGSLRSPIKGGRGRHPPTTVGWQKTRRIALLSHVV